MIYSSTPIRFKGAFGKLHGQLNRFSSGFWWLVSSLWRSNASLTVAVIVAACFGVLISALSIFTVFALLNSVESGADAKGGLTALVAFEEMPLVPVGVAVMAGLLIGFSLVYWSKFKSVSLASSFHVYCAERIVHSFGGNLGTDVDFGSQKQIQGAIYRLMTADCRQASMAVRRLLQSVVPALIVFPGFMVLFAIDAITTLLIIAVVVLVAPVFYRISVGATRATREFESLNPEVRDHGMSVVCAHDTGESFIGTPGQPFMRSVDSFRRRFSSLVHAEFASHVVMVLGVGILLLSLGPEALEGKLSWSVVVAYLVVLRFSMNSFRQLFQVVATFSRLFPGIYRLSHFFNDALPDERSDRLDEAATIRVMKAGVYDGRRLYNVRRSEVVGLVSPVALTRYSARYYCSLFSAPLNSSDFLRQMLLLDRHGEVLCVRGAGGSRENIDMEEADWRELLFSVVAGKNVFIEAGVAASFRGLLKALRQGPCRNVFVCSRTLAGGAKYSPAFQLIADARGRVIAAGTPQFLSREQSEIERILTSEKSSRTNVAKSSDDSELDALEDF